MKAELILLPVFAQIALTFIMLFWMAGLRVQSVRNKKVPARYFKTYQGDYKLPEKLLQVARNFHNQLETPILFYAVIAFILISDQVDMGYIALAWTYFATRIVHTVIHVSYNHILHRMIIFLFSLIVLLSLWTRFFIQTAFS
jgi:hypothetical protein